MKAIQIKAHPIEWSAPTIENLEVIPKGDMPGDKIQMNSTHLMKAQNIFPELLTQIYQFMESSQNQKVVISVHGGSGVGKSEIGALLSYYLNEMNIGSYILSGDNYPHRIPKYNDIERMRVFRTGGLQGLVSKGEYNNQIVETLNLLRENDQDASPELLIEYPWLDIYQEYGKKALMNYLGTSNEIDFAEISNILTEFKRGESSIYLKRMGRTMNELWYEKIDFSNIKVLVIEWTHGNNENLKGVDIPILLNSTPQETLAHRRSRNRDGATDSPFTTMVLGIEQDLLAKQAPKAKMIISKNGEIVTFVQYLELMEKDA